MLAMHAKLILALLTLSLIPTVNPNHHHDQCNNTHTYQHYNACGQTSFCKGQRETVSCKINPVTSILRLYESSISYTVQGLSVTNHKHSTHHRP